MRRIHLCRVAGNTVWSYDRWCPVALRCVQEELYHLTFNLTFNAISMQLQSDYDTTTITLVYNSATTCVSVLYYTVVEWHTWRSSTESLSLFSERTCQAGGTTSWICSRRSWFCDAFVQTRWRTRCRTLCLRTSVRSSSSLNRPISASCFMTPPRPHLSSLSSLSAPTRPLDSTSSLRRWSLARNCRPSHSARDRHVDSVYFHSRSDVGLIFLLILIRFDSLEKESVYC